MKLDGVKVIDLSLFLPGPMLSLVMSDHGADVIKVEPPGAGEPTRAIGEKKNATSIYFRNTHRGKKCIQLDLKREEGREILFKLVSDADVVIEGFRPGVASRLGVDYDAIRAINPRIVYCSISAFGQTGPYTQKPAHDLAVQALSGVLSLSEGRDGLPAMPNMQVADMLASLYGLSGVLMALLRAKETGEGDYVDIAMLDSVVSWTPHLTDRVFALGEALPPKDGRLTGKAAFYNYYQCKDDRWIVLGGTETKFVKNLLEAFDGLDLIDNAKPSASKEEDQVLRDFLQEKFSTKTQQEWSLWFEDKDVAFAPVLDFKEAFADTNTTVREMISKDDHGNEVIGTPIKYRNEPAKIDPTLGERAQDAITILRQHGVGDAVIEALRKDGGFDLSAGSARPMYCGGSCPRD